MSGRKRYRLAAPLLFGLSTTLVPVLPAGTVNTSGTGTNLLTYTATDGNGNTNQVSRTVIVIDTTAPAIAFSFTNLTLSAGSNCQAALPNLTTEATMLEGARRAVGLAAV